VPGLEFAGVVEAVGLEVREVQRGDRVMGITGGGAMASHVITHARELVRIPEPMSFTDAAAIPEVFFTAWDALHAQGSLRPGMTVLVHAIGSGVGTAALQIATMAGARVIGTSRSADKLERCASLGLEHGIVVAAPGREARDAGTAPSFAPEVHALTGGGGADVVIDTVGAAYLEENVRALAPRGVIVCLGLLGGVQGSLPMGLLLGKRARIVGSVLRSRPLEEKIALAQRFAREALPAIRRGELRPIVDRVLPITSIADAHRAMEADANVGKIVLTL
jgi:NADPH:quinone reductase-like Zn-dependent oxidoreductase